MEKNIGYFFLGISIFFCLFSFRLAGAFTLTDSDTVSVSAVVGTAVPPIDPGSSGGGGGVQTGVRFSGYAYPGAIVTVRRNFLQVLSVVADDRGYFSLLVPETTQQLFTLSATDTMGRDSTLLNFPTLVYSGYLTDIAGIRFAPTITTDKVSVKKGAFLTITGASLPSQIVVLAFEGHERMAYRAEADSLGAYSITIPISFAEGEYSIRASYERDSRTSRAVRLTVGAANIPRIEATTNIPGDCNVDQKIDIVDFSILAYWFGKKNPPRCVDTNHDDVINLVDFSILAFYWNG